MRSARRGRGTRRAVRGLAVGLAVLWAGMAAPAQAADALRAQPGAPPGARGGGMATDRGDVQGYGSVTDPSRRQRGDDGWRGDRGWDRHRQGYGHGDDWRYQHWSYRPYPGGYYYPGYAVPVPGYAVPAPGQWVWNGWNWVWVPGY